jgi:hypothetical protein
MNEYIDKIKGFTAQYKVFLNLPDSWDAFKVEVTQLVDECNKSFKVIKESLTTNEGDGGGASAHEPAAKGSIASSIKKGVVELVASKVGNTITSETLGGYGKRVYNFLTSKELTGRVIYQMVPDLLFQKN